MFFGLSLYIACAREYVFGHMKPELDYRHFLREELVARCGNNPAYSARAMARDLDVSPAFFSQIMSGARALSEERAMKLAENIRWTTRKRRVFVKLVRLHSTTDERLRREVLADIKKTSGRKVTPLPQKFHDLEHEEFKLISEWYHFAIVELSELGPLADESNEVARRLGISNITAMQAIERLIRRGLLERRDGILSKPKANYRMGAVPSSAIRSFHKEHLKKAAQAIEDQPVETRDFSGTTIAIDPKKIPRAKALIRRFQNDLAELLESGEKTAVYHLAVQLYRLDETRTDDSADAKSKEQK